MSPAEFFCLYDTHKPAEMVGHIPKTEFDQLAEILREAKANHAKLG
jgi:hypothetical protein